MGRQVIQGVVAACGRPAWKECELDETRDEPPTEENELFKADSPRWRELPNEPGSEQERRSHDRVARSRDGEGSIAREQPRARQTSTGDDP